MEQDDPSVPVVVDVEIDSIADRELVGGRLLTDEEFHREWKRQPRNQGSNLPDP